jgi:hypothetical protein
LPLPSVPICGRPRSLARSETAPGSASAQRAAGFGEFGVALLAVAVLDHPAGAFHQNLLEVVRIDLHVARAAGAAGHVAKDLIDQLAQAGRTPGA